MTVLVTGARGNIGRRIVARLAEAGHRIRASATDDALEVPDGVETAVLDITVPSDAAALQDVDAVFLYPTFGKIDDFLKAAGAAGVGHIVLLSSPAAYDTVEFTGPIGLAHRAVEGALRDSGLEHTVLYPSWLSTNTIRDWAVEIRTTGRIGIANPDWQVNPIHIDDVAAVAAELLTGDGFRARMQVVTGPESMRQRDIVAAIADTTGRPIEVDELSREAALAKLPEWFPAEVFSSLMDVAEAHEGVTALVNNNVERITGRPARRFREWAEAHRDAFTSD